MRGEAARDPVAFWEGMARGLEWFSPWEEALRWEPPFARWFVGGTLNASHNALDVHRAARAAKPAVVWEGEDGEVRTITYSELLAQVCRFANALRGLGVSRGDRVALYMPMVPELPVAMLACARIGAVHTVVFSGFSASSLRDRITDAGCAVVVTADGGYRRGRTVRLKDIADEAVRGLDSVRHVVVLERAGCGAGMSGRDSWWHDLVRDAPAECGPEHLESSHPLFILYTSGTTGRPKGVLHGTGGYLTHVRSTFGWAFNPSDRDVFFCTADIGWVTGHSYAVYGPLMHGATVLMYEGAPDHPSASRTWEVLERHGVSIFYTTPTLLRMLMGAGRDAPGSFDLSALRLLGTVGEPINPGVWRWYHGAVGGGRCPIVDTWWQTETGGMMVSPLPSLGDAGLKPGSAGTPVPGIDVAVLDGDGAEAGPGVRGHLVVRRPWPGMLMTLWGNDARYESAYWSEYPGSYHTGDYAMRDADGCLWLLGRADDVLKVAGHRIGTAELEGCIVGHPDVAESAVCGVDDEEKGEAIVAFAVPMPGAEAAGLAGSIRERIRSEIGPIATPSQVHVVPVLPKTRSGKIMRRMLRALASGREVGDSSTLEDAGAPGRIREALGRGP